MGRGVHITDATEAWRPDRRRHWTGIVLLLLSVLVAACGPLATDLPRAFERALEEAPQGTAPLLLDEGVALVPVTIGPEEPLLFVLDTGASMTLLSPSTRDRLGFAQDDGDRTRLTGATGDGYYQRLWLDSLSVAGHTVSDFEVAVVDLEEFQQSGVRYAGVLGQDFLQHFDFAYDLPRRELRLFPQPPEGSSPPVFEGLETLNHIPLKSSPSGNGFITFDISVGGAAATAIFDTGSRHTILNWRAAQQDGMDASTGTGMGETFGIGIGEPALTEVYTFTEMRAGDIAFTPREVSIADLPVFRAFGLQYRPAVIIGNDLVGDRLVVVSYSNRTIYFSPSKSD